jgi:DNA-binding LacI/PurR family transcriptional regulator
VAKSQTSIQGLIKSIRTRIHAESPVPGTKFPTEEQIAAEFGVTRTLAHRAIKVLADEGLLVRRPRIGTVIAEPHAKQLRNVALLFYNAAAFPQNAYLQGISDGLPTNCATQLLDSRDDATIEIDRLRQLRDVDGLIIYPTCDPRVNSVLEELAGSGFPIVCIDRYPSQALDRFGSDEVATATGLMKLLKNEGHQRIAHFTDDAPFVSTIQERLNGYLEQIDESSRTSRRYLRRFPSSHGWSFPQLAQAVFDSMFTLMNMPEPPTAVFCAHDQYLAAVLAAADQLGLVIGRDLAVASYNDWPNLPVLQLERVHRAIPSSHELGRLAALRLAERVVQPGLEPISYRIPGQLIPALPFDSNVRTSRTIQ